MIFVNNKFLIVVSLIIFSGFILVGCSEQGKEFKSFIPDPTAEVGEFFAIDSTNFIKIEGGEIIKEKEERILIIIYSWKNEGNRADTTFDNFTLTASQNGEVLEPTLDFVEDKKKLVITVKPGEILENIEQGFILSTEEPVTLSILGSDFYFIADNKPMYTYPVKVTINSDQ